MRHQTSSYRGHLKRNHNSEPPKKKNNNITKTVANNQKLFYVATYTGCNYYILPFADVFVCQRVHMNILLDRECKNAGMDRKP